MKEFNIGRRTKMKFKQTLLMALTVLSLVSSAATAAAGDFDWTRDFNIKAEADPSGFRVKIAARFRIGDPQVNAVLRKVDSPADAYMVLRLGEMAAKPTDYVIKQYRTSKGKGWGALAKSLGIKPGSKEFHALKRGSDLYGNDTGEKGKGKGKGKGKN